MNPRNRLTKSALYMITQTVLSRIGCFKVAKQIAFDYLQISFEHEFTLPGVTLSLSLSYFSYSFNRARKRIEEAR